MSKLSLRPWQRIALEQPAIEAEDTMNPVLHAVDMASLWSRILSVNCGFE